MHSQPALLRLRSSVLENPAICAIRDLARAVRQRWLALSFARRFYRQARDAEVQLVDSEDVQAPVITSEIGIPAHDFMESVMRRSLPARIYLLLQLRIASQLASIPETTLRAQLCRDAGWSDDQIGAALLGNTNACFCEPEKLMLRYAEDMTRTPIDIDPQVVRQLRSHFSPADMVELTALIAHENFRMRFANAQAKLQ